jgi:uncharacterized protein with HEPN domain
VTDERTRLLEIRDAIDRTQRHAADGRESFLASETIRDAVILTLAMIGEAARGLSQQLRDENQDVPWKEIIAFRNRVLHGYFSVDAEIVWEVVERDLPVLRQRIDSLLQAIPPASTPDPTP